MNNQQIVEVFENIAGLLDIKGEPRYTVIAYQRAARTISRRRWSRWSETAKTSRKSRG